MWVGIRNCGGKEEKEEDVEKTMEQTIKEHSKEIPYLIKLFGFSKCFSWSLWWHSGFLRRPMLLRNYEFPKCSSKTVVAVDGGNVAVVCRTD